MSSKSKFLVIAFGLGVACSSATYAENSTDFTDEPTTVIDDGVATFFEEPTIDRCAEESLADTGSIYEAPEAIEEPTAVVEEEISVPEEVVEEIAVSIEAAVAEEFKAIEETAEGSFDGLPGELPTKGFTAELVIDEDDAIDDEFGMPKPIEQKSWKNIHIETAIKAAGKVLCNAFEDYNSNKKGLSKKAVTIGADTFGSFCDHLPKEFTGNKAMTKNQLIFRTLVPAIAGVVARVVWGGESIGNGNETFRYNDLCKGVGGILLTDILGKKKCFLDSDDSFRKDFKVDLLSVISRGFSYGADKDENGKGHLYFNPFPPESYIKNLVNISARVKLEVDWLPPVIELAFKKLNKEGLISGEKTFRKTLIVEILASAITHGIVEYATSNIRSPKTDTSKIDRIQKAMGDALINAEYSIDQFESHIQRLRMLRLEHENRIKKLEEKA
ncbi:hypothetical protein HOD08_01060, partial [bacterium]|nr:hypothetical protein [bacterium]